MVHASRLGATGASIVNKLMMRNRGAMNAAAAVSRTSAPLNSRPKMLRLHGAEGQNTISQSIDSQGGRSGACAIGPFMVRTSVLVAQCDGRRGFAKKGAKGKGGKGEEEESGEIVDTGAMLKEMALDCSASINNLDTELAALRTGRADPRILDKVRVEAYAATVSLEKVAQVTVNDSRTLTVTVFDPELTSSVDKAIRGAGLDLNPQVAGSTLRVPIPKVTQEGRKKLTLQASKIAENSKIVVRRVRQEYMSQGKKALKDSAKDDLKKYEDDVQKVHDKAVKEIDAKVKAKQTELLDD